MINVQRLQDTFLQYVQIDSESGQEQAMCEAVVNDLTVLGYKVIKYPPLPGHPSTGYSFSVLAEGDASRPGLVLAAHVDTVVPGKGVQPKLCPDGYIRSNGETVLGSDDKSGVAALVELLRALKETGVNHCPVQIFFTIQEEIGTVGARSLPQEALLFKQGVVLDSSGDIGRVVTSSPGRVQINATVIGRAAHAGNAPEKGVSAIRVMAKAIDKMHLQRIDQETTANVGTFFAEGAPNIVSAKASIVAEIRSRNVDKLEKEKKYMRQCLEETCAEMGAQLVYEISEESVGYVIPEDAPVLQRLAKACEKTGVKFFTAASGGGSDANIFSTKGMTAVNISTGMDKVHTTQEQISLKNLENCGKLLWHLVVEA